MEKSFSDKQRTIDTLINVRSNINKFRVRYPELALVGLARVEEINTKSILAHNVTMHYNTYVHAGILNIWGKVHADICTSTTLIEDSKQTVAELTAHYPTMEADCAGILKYFRPAPTDETTWAEYASKYAIFEEINGKVRNAYYKVSQERHEKFLASLEVPVRPSQPVSKEQHEAFLWLLKHHDYYYSYSDDNSVYNRGAKQLSRIMIIARSHPHYYSMYDVLGLAHGREAGDRKKAEDVWEKLALEVAKEEE